MADWPSRRIGELADWRGGMTPSMANPAFWAGGDIPWISSREVVGGVLLDTERKVTSLAVKETSLRLIPAGSVAVVVRSGILMHTFPVALVPFVSTVNQDIKIGTPVDGVLPQFLAFTLQANADQILQRCRKTGTTVQSVDVPSLMSVEVGLPPLNEQRRIVDLIGALDSQIAALRDGARNTVELHERLAESLIGEAGPSVTVREVAHPDRGLVGGPFGSSLTTKDYVPHGVPVIRGINMPKIGRFIGGDFIYVSDEKASLLKSNLALPNDVIFTQRGTLGQVGMVPEGHDLLVVSQSQMRLRVDPSVAIAEYVFFAFSRPSIVQSLQEQNTATANPHINLGILAKQAMPLPDLVTQCRIASILLGSLELVERYAAEVASLTQVRAVLLSALLNREVEVPESYDSVQDEAV